MFALLRRDTPSSSLEKDAIKIKNLIKNIGKQPEIDVTATDKDKKNILHIVCNALKDINVIRFIISLNKINVNDKSKDGSTPLLYLCDKYESAESS